jgi:2-hydroxychromene-2-carboxylate isomerase
VIELFFDFISPYAYLAWLEAAALGARTGHAIEPRPVLLAGILNALGTKGPAEVPARRAYVIKDALRAAERAGAPLRLPPAHPFNPLLALRVAGLELDPALRGRVIDALFQATWGGGGGIDTPERVAAALRSVGADADELIARAHEPAAKQRLQRSTDEALARGAFGVPTLFIGDELFFGYESFPYVERFLRGDDPAAQQAELVAEWARLPASAVRRAP